ncbi:MAG: histidine triad nucleotide-binding protein [candidate division Zixibacteria bacterium RBG_16_53_22]|nr:MAG: histidine triad nucleotide-binding protein [candidate division Zixibacteria bacterium RBG_16_53_22]
MPNCIFCAIVNDHRQAKILYEDTDYLAFEDLHPQAPAHFLVIPKRHIETILDADKETLGNLIHIGVRVARKMGLDKNGFRTVINCKRHAGQSVDHLHVHVMGGRWFSWPPG